MKSRPTPWAPPPAAASAPTDNGAPFTIAGFCAWYHLSRPYYDQLKSRGQTPRELRVGRRVLITRQAAREWEALRPTGPDPGPV